MTTIEQARKAKEYLLPLFPCIGISHDSSGYYIKIFLSEPTNLSIPDTVDNVRVKSVIVGTSKL